MTPAQYNKLIQKLGFTSQESAGIWLGVSARTGQNYATKGPTETVAKLLRMMVRLGIEKEELR
jgi:hypothetical protein